MLNKQLGNHHAAAFAWQILYDDFIAETYTRGTLCGHMMFFLYNIQLQHQHIAKIKQ